MTRLGAETAVRPGLALRIRLLGGFRVQVDDRTVTDGDWRLQKARALVKLLALAPRHRLERDDVMERLWPEVEPEAALNNFYYALHGARAVLDRNVQGTAARASALGLAGGIVALAPGGALTVDVESFEAAATAAHNSKDTRVYRVALDLYAGELLPEERYEDWAARPRERLHDLQLGMLSELARLQQQRGERAAALGTLSRLVAEVPTYEDARTRLMTMYATAGQRQQALREYARLRTALREELDVEPGATAQRVYARDPRRQRASSSNQDWRPPARTGARRLASRRASVGRTDAHDEGQLSAPARVRRKDGWTMKLTTTTQTWPRSPQTTCSMR